MFNTIFQTGQSGVEVLTPSGKSPPSRLLKINGPNNLIIKEYERDIKGYKIILSGKNNQSSSIQCPAASRDTLALIQPLLIFQLKSASQDDPLNLEIVVIDSTGQRRRFLISTTFRAIDITALHAQIPWIQERKEKWTNVVFNLQFMTQECFSAKFASVDSFHLRPMCSLRKIFTLPLPQLIVNSSEQLVIPVPPVFDFPLGTMSTTCMFSLRPPLAISTAMPSNGLLQVAGHQINRKKYTSVSSTNNSSNSSSSSNNNNKILVDGSPQRMRGTGYQVPVLPFTDTNKLNMNTPHTATPGRMKRSEVLISAGNNATKGEIITSKNIELNAVNNTYEYTRQIKELSIENKKDDDLSALLAARFRSRYKDEDLLLPEPPRASSANSIQKLLEEKNNEKGKEFTRKSKAQPVHNASSNIIVTDYHKEEFNVNKSNNKDTHLNSHSFSKLTDSHLSADSLRPPSVLPTSFHTSTHNQKMNLDLTHHDTSTAQDEAYYMEREEQNKSCDSNYLKAMIDKQVSNVSLHNTRDIANDKLIEAERDREMVKQAEARENEIHAVLFVEEERERLKQKVLVQEEKERLRQEMAMQSKVIRVQQQEEEQEALRIREIEIDMAIRFQEDAKIAAETLRIDIEKESLAAIRIQEEEPEREVLRVKEEGEKAELLRHQQELQEQEALCIKEAEIAAALRIKKENEVAAETLRIDVEKERLEAIRIQKEELEREVLRVKKEREIKEKAEFLRIQELQEQEALLIMEEIALALRIKEENEIRRVQETIETLRLENERLEYCRIQAEQQAIETARLDMLRFEQEENDRITFECQRKLDEDVYKVAIENEQILQEQIAMKADMERKYQEGLLRAALEAAANAEQRLDEAAKQHAMEMNEIKKESKRLEILQQKEVERRDREKEIERLVKKERRETERLEEQRQSEMLALAKKVKEDLLIQMGKEKDTADSDINQYLIPILNSLTHRLSSVLSLLASQEKNYKEEFSG